jgi:cytochrome P450
LSSTRVPPGPKSRIPGRILFILQRDRLAFVTRLARYGDIAYFTLGSERIYFLNRPEWIADVLVTHSRKFRKGPGLEVTKHLLGEGLLASEGDFHLRQRRLAQPAFHRQRIAAYASTMSCYARRLSDEWSHSWRPGERRDIHQDMMRLTLAIVGKTLFDADVESDASEIGEALAVAIKMFDRLVLPHAKLLNYVPGSGMGAFRRAKERLDAIIYRLIAEHRAGPDRGDLLSMLLLARDTEEGEASSAIKEFGESMSDLQVRNETMTILLAGHETVANALTWTWYLLSSHPEIEARLHGELDTHLAGRLPGESDWPNLRYTYAVLAESMRLYPPGWATGRRALESMEIGGYTIPPEAVVIMSQYTMHRDARYFRDPERFDPSRWMQPPQEASQLPKFAYFPFGGGPHLCIGEGFAWMEGVLVLATLAQHWKLRLEPGHRVRFEPKITLRPGNGMPMTLDRRMA